MRLKSDYGDAGFIRINQFKVVLLYFIYGKKPYNMFGGNKITRDEFAGKFAEEPGEDWLDLNSYNTESVTIPDSSVKNISAFEF